MQLEVTVQFNRKGKKPRQYGAIVEYNYDKNWEKSEEAIHDSLMTIGNKFIQEEYYEQPRGT